MPEHGLLAWLVIGVALGLGAKFLGGGFDMSGCLATVVTGITGAIVAGYVTDQMLGYNDVDGHFALFAATAGAVVVLWVLDTLVPRRPY